MQSTRQILLSASLLSGLSAFATPAFAQSPSAENSGLDVIIVTAQKREENLQSTPISIAAFGDTQLNDLDVQDPERLADFVPNVSIGDGTGQGGAGSQISIRGVNEARVSPVLDPAVGIYIDDVYYGRPQLGFLRLLDVERVEVLRGPQGTLFGKNAVGGAVRYITKKPNFDGINGFAEFTAGSRNRLDFEGAVNYTASDVLAFRLSGGYLSQDGFVERLSDGVKLGDENTYMISAKARFQPNDALDINLGIDYSNSDTDNGPQKLVDYDRGNGSSASAGWNRYWGGTANRYDVAIPDSLYEVAGEADHAVNEATSTGVSLDIVYDISENTSLRSISGLRRVEQFSFNDPDDQASAVTFFGDTIQRDLDFWSTELQLNGSYLNDRLAFVGGAYYSVEEPNQVDIKDADGRFGPPGPNFRAGLLIRNDSAYQETKSLGLYSQATFDVTDKFALTAGIRYTQDKKQYTISQLALWDFDLADQAAAFGLTPLTAPTYGTCNPITTPAGCVSQSPLSGGETFSAWTPRFAAEYQATDDIMLFASASKGFKAGGTNDSVADIDTPFSPENLWSYEAGIRSELFDNRLRLNVTGFYSDYTDKQITVAASPVCVNRCTTNVGDATIKGIEIETIFALDNNLDVFANFGLLDAEWKDITNNRAGVTLDSPFSRAPKHSASIGFKHTYDLGNGYDFKTSANLTYKDDQASSPQDSTQLTIPAYTLVNGRLGFSPNDSNWSLSLFCNNCFNEEYITGGAIWAGTLDGTPFSQYRPGGSNAGAPPAISYVNVGEKRTVGVQLRKDF